MGACLPYRYEEPVEDVSGGRSKSGRECVMSGNRTTQVRVGWDLGCCCLHRLLAYDAPRHPVCPRSRGWGIFGGRSREGDEGKPIERHTEPVGRDSDEDRTSTSPRPVSLRLVCGEPSYLALRLSAVTPAPSAVSRLPSDRCDDVPWFPFCFDRPQATCRGGGGSRWTHPPPSPWGRGSRGSGGYGTPRTISLAQKGDTGLRSRCPAASPARGEKAEGATPCPLSEPMWPHSPEVCPRVRRGGLWCKVN